MLKFISRKGGLKEVDVLLDCPRCPRPRCMPVGMARGHNMLKPEPVWTCLASALVQRLAVAALGWRVCREHGKQLELVPANPRGILFRLLIHC